MLVIAVLTEAFSRGLVSRAPTGAAETEWPAVMWTDLPGGHLVSVDGVGIMVIEATENAQCEALLDTLANRLHLGDGLRRGKHTLFVSVPTTPGES